MGWPRVSLFCVTNGLSIACVTRDQLTWTSVPQWFGHLNNFFSFYLFISKLNNYGSPTGFFKKPVVVVVFLLIGRSVRSLAKVRGGIAGKAGTIFESCVLLPPPPPHLLNSTPHYTPCIGESLFTFFASLAYVPLFLLELPNRLFRILKELRN